MKNQTVIITGASRGIGAKMAETFAFAGYNVIINYYQSKDEALQLEQHLLSLGLSVKAIKADVTNRTKVDAMMATAIEVFGQIDILVNNAGIASYQLFTDLSENEWDKIMAVNVKGIYNCSQSCLPHMLSHKQWKILNVSSIWGITGASCEVAYSASKAAIIGLTKALAKELAPSGITVNCIAPGAVDTDMMKGFTREELDDIISQIPLNRLATVDDIAKTALFLLSENNNYMTGQVISPNGGMVI